MLMNDVVGLGGVGCGIEIDKNMCYGVLGGVICEIEVCLVFMC